MPQITVKHCKESYSGFVQLSLWATNT